MTFASKASRKCQRDMPEEEKGRQGYCRAEDAPIGRSGSRGAPGGLPALCPSAEQPNATHHSCCRQLQVCPATQTCIFLILISEPREFLLNIIINLLDHTATCNNDTRCRAQSGTNAKAVAITSPRKAAHLQGAQHCPLPGNPALCAAAALDIVQEKSDPCFQSAGFIF